MPVVIHSRDAKEDTISILKNFRDQAFGVIHCFTYDYLTAKTLVDIGYYISFSGIVAFKNATEIQEAAQKLPLECILIETDAPFLAPPPFRGKRNEPSYMKFILDKMFSLRKESNSDVENKLFENSIKFMNRKAYHYNA
ncbi:hydrolase, TatD domain protein [Leptospira interrogans serovar Icterohaemorrhagiae str. Verdun HP]|uniref:Hydrolase, TatD domain protein n=1 Tax=Leptospira interrogans serovar Icterohaemorrhagiae str. Verdun HP TaxID=1049910 RepID=M6RM92_LEPIR|nr:hydrolase, TatD domain protein [Leptospira interrogans serovar Icterohaemorrhagiae str. Verdun HP]OBZ98120.1 Hydrolase, TatD family [Leptospira interrogans serovar Copenhageni/Icterohaemorrhagiae]OCC27720.1 DNAase [Leptospira interrogans serovar Canicola]